MAVYEITQFRSGLSDFVDKGTVGSFKYGANLDIRKRVDSISAGQAIKDIGNFNVAPSNSLSPSASNSPSSSLSPSLSPSVSPSSSISPSIHISPSASRSPSASSSPSASNSPSASVSPSSSTSPSPSPSAGLKTVFSDLIHFYVKCSDGFVYGFGNTGKVYKINPVDDFVQQVYDLHKSIIGAAEKPSSGGKIYLEFATNTELHRKEIPGLSNWNDVDKAGAVQGDSWPKNNLTGADWHTMTNVGGDILICNASTLAMSAYDDSYTNEALDLIPGNVARTIVERNGRAVIGTALQADLTKGVNGAVDTEVPLIQVGDQGDIFYADFNTSVVVKRLPGGGKVNPGGMCNQVSQVQVFDWEQDSLSWIDKQNIGNMALLGVYGAQSGYGGIYTYGRKDKNGIFALNLEYQFDAVEIGAVVSVNGKIYFSYYDGVGFGVKVTDLQNKATAIYSGLEFRSPMKNPAQITTYKQIELYMSPLPAGCSVQFWYQMDKSGTYLQAKTADGQNQYSTANGQKAVFSIMHNSEIYEPRVVVIPSGNNSPEVHRIRTYFV